MLLMYIRVPTELGVGGDIVMKLTESLEKGKHLKMFADNYFTSIKLAIALKERSSSMLELYKQQIQSRRWYMYIFWHTIMTSAVNSWLWYRRHCKLLQEGKTMSLYTFISYIASGLVKVKTIVGRPLSDTPSIKQEVASG